MELDGTVAVVTGGSRGIGLAIASELARGGAAVAVIGRDREKAEHEAGRLPGGRRHFGLGCDVGSAEQVTEAVRQVEEELGGTGVLVNNAGITRDNILVRLKDADWEAVMRVNLGGTFNMTRAIARGMMKRREGTILNVSSVVGLTGNAGQSNYSASKAGILGFTKSVARELASRGVRCNAIAPGFIETDMTKALDEKQTDSLRSQIPLGRLGVPADVAGVARFLAGPGASYITGQVIVVDGGMAM